MVTESVLAVDLASVAVPASVALLAAVCATAVGYRRWKKKHSFEHGKTLLADRSTAYKELWSRLEAIERRLRELDVCDDDFDRRVLDLDAYVLRSESYFDEGVRVQLRSYLDSAREASKIVQAYPEFQPNEESVTGDAGIDAEGMRQLFKVVSRAEEARTAIMKEVRKDLGA